MRVEGLGFREACLGGVGLGRVAGGGGGGVSLHPLQQTTLPQTPKPVCTPPINPPRCLDGLTVDVHGPQRPRGRLGF